MPPRLHPSTFSSAVTTCSSLRPQCVSQPARTCREFSQTPCQRVTKRRRMFYEWLNTTGAALKEPIPGSTNYLGAYDKFGNLIRASPGWSRKRKDDQPKVEEPASTTDQPGGQEIEDELEISVRRSEQRKVKNKDDENELPPETAEDLRPFPMNKYFRSQPVLSEELREAIYQRVKQDGATVALASVEFGVSNERVGAVVRLKQMEKEWIAQGKVLAIPYSKAVLAMVPTTPYVDPSKPENKYQRPITHEAINDLIVHPATRQQLFVPVAESREFTRVDAGKAFDNGLLPADDRIPHPELVLAEKEIAMGLSLQERTSRALQRMDEEAQRKRRKEDKIKAELMSLKTVPKRRWDFVFKDVSVDAVGRDGRDYRGVGWRYGMPHEDRKRGQVKIPRRIEA
ncbi:hypothetical protein K504DRAFT_457642 [Pleomassaria siparia CBS 279.74]|uniref:Ribosomal protein S35, mitochondrial n=1 Tax=Pleomassaria siparia CBS 279.74 TaxID=1314801 RepID=A0A6G1KSW3_9PLEO|nr:hypothetical protein K504DRAFT_457642 [Pleomassaria siparia CBS 279.74]